MKELPKIELHVHLDGSIRITTAAEILDKSEEWVKENLIAPFTCSNLNEYLSKFMIPIQILQTRENLVRVSHELAEDLVKDGVIYAEVRFAPMQHTKNGLTPDEVVKAVLEGFSSSRIPIGVILCMMRNGTIEENVQVIDLAKKYIKEGVCGIDLAGAESIYPTKQFLPLFEIARKKQVPYTIHAGEADGISSIDAALLAGAKRLGHGVRVIEDETTLKKVKQNKILLEVCPTSNVQTKAVTTYMQHPIRQLYDAGCLISINTDNRTVSNVTLTEEYQRLQNQFHFTKEDFCKINKQAVNCSFSDDFTKKKLIKMIDEYILSER